MNKKDISSEDWRRYEWIVPETNQKAECYIPRPITLYYEKGSSCHVVTAIAGQSTNDIVAYCVPSVGRFGCVLTWGKDSGEDPVLFVSASKEE